MEKKIMEAFKKKGIELEPDNQILKAVKTSEDKAEALQVLKQMKYEIELAIKSL